MFLGPLIEEESSGLGGFGVFARILSKSAPLGFRIVRNPRKVETMEGGWIRAGIPYALLLYFTLKGA